MSGKEEILSVQQLKAAYPEIYQAAFDAGVQCERGRVCELARSWTSHDKDVRLLCECIADGSELTTSLTKRSHLLGGQLREAREAALFATASDAELEAHFQQNAELRAEFGGDIEAFLAFVQAEREGVAKIRH